MPVLKNKKHEQFAQAVAIGHNATKAYKLAGYNGDRKNAARLLATNGDIRARVDELAGRIAAKAEERAVWTAADRLTMLDRIAERNWAFDPRTTVSAIAEANKMQGSHAPAKQELTGRDGQPLNPPVQRIVIVAASEEDAEEDEE